MKKQKEPARTEGDNCPPRFVHVEKIEGNNTCAPRCDVDVFFRKEDKHFAKVRTSIIYTCIIIHKFHTLYLHTDIIMFTNFLTVQEDKHFANVHTSISNYS